VDECKPLPLAPLTLLPRTATVHAQPPPTPGSALPRGVPAAAAAAAPTVPLTRLGGSLYCQEPAPRRAPLAAVLAILIHILGVSPSQQGLTLVDVRAQLEQLQDTLMS
jgi:hypothetical protein